MEKRGSAAGFCMGDLIVILAVLLMAAAVFFAFFRRPDTPTASVRVMTEHGETVYPLDTPREITVTSAGHTLTVTIVDGTVRVTASDCPNGICTATGEISAAGQSIACVPGQVLIEITADGGSDTDDKTFILP